MKVRREKISERMKFLQELVPGCSKVNEFARHLNSQRSCLFLLKSSLNRLDGVQVTGKAVMLDEIINYVQSLQRQVEVRFWLDHLFMCDVVQLPVTFDGVHMK